MRRATAENIARDRQALAGGALGTLHARLVRELAAMARTPDQKRLYAVPYAVAYAEPMMRAFGHLTRRRGCRCAVTTRSSRGYLRNRARDLLTNDYESGDASWVTGRFKHLNAQIGAYETYDDALFGVKAFPAVSLLLANEQATAELRRRHGRAAGNRGRAALRAPQARARGHPGRRVRRHRGLRTGARHEHRDDPAERSAVRAPVRPHDPAARNILEQPRPLRAATSGVWRAAIVEAHAADLAIEGNFQRTLWHEVGHYLGVDRDKRGRTLDAALEDHADAMEEMKADLVSLFAIDAMHRAGTMTPAMLRAVQAAGIRRTLLNVKPRREQPYQTMQLAQFNYFLENGLLAFDGTSGQLAIRYERYADVVTSLLREVLAVQDEGDKTAAARFFDRWGAWTPELHERLAVRIREAQGPRFRLVRYAALGE